jgi:hypothetical protein
MKLFIYTLSGEICCYIEINNLSNIIIPIFNAIIPILKPDSTFIILTEEHKHLHNYLKDNNTTELENYITKIYNSLQNEHILYIIKEYYYDNKNRSLVDYKNYLEKLNYHECNEIARHTDLTIRDKYIIYKIVNKYGKLLSLLNKDLKGNREIVLEAVKNNGYVLLYASEELKRDKKIVLYAVIQNGYALLYASKELKGDKEIVLAAINQNGLALLYASDELKGDKEIVLAAVNQNGYALQYASNELKKDREVLLTTVKQNGLALIYASEELLEDKEIVLAAVNQNNYSLEYAYEELKA